MSVCGPTAVPASCCFLTLGSGGGEWRNTVARQRSSCLQVKGTASLRPHIYHAPSASNQCCLTLRSSGAPTAGHQARSGGTLYIFAIPGLASCRCRPLSSNVRQLWGQHFVATTDKSVPDTINLPLSHSGGPRETRKQFFTAGGHPFEPYRRDQRVSFWPA